MREGVVVQLTADGYIVTCPVDDVVGHGPTEADAWTDFWAAYRAHWKPPAPDTADTQNPRPALRPSPKRRKTRTIRVRDLFG